MSVETKTRAIDFRKRRIAAAIACVITLIILSINARCSAQHALAEGQADVAVTECADNSVTKMSLLSQKVTHTNR